MSVMLASLFWILLIFAICCILVIAPVHCLCALAASGLLYCCFSDPKKSVDCWERAEKAAEFQLLSNPSPATVDHCFMKQQGDYKGWWYCTFDDAVDGGVIRLDEFRCDP